MSYERDVKSCRFSLSANTAGFSFSLARFPQWNTIFPWRGSVVRARGRMRGEKELKNEEVVFSEFSPSALWYVNSLLRFQPSAYFLLSLIFSPLHTSLPKRSLFHLLISTCHCLRSLSCSGRLYRRSVPQINNRTFSAISLTVNSKCKLGTRQRVRGSALFAVSIFLWDLLTWDCTALIVCAKEYLNSIYRDTLFYVFSLY